MQSISETIKRLSLTGLSDSSAKSKLEKEGFNELPHEKNRTFLHIIFEIIKEPMFLLLIACGVIYIFLGDFEEALMLLGFVFIVIGITIYQENKTEKALSALKDLSSPRALVLRGGEHRRIAGKDVVRDDIIILSEGDRVPADAVVLASANLSIDESLLTGESVPVRKKAVDVFEKKMGSPGGDDLPYVFSGTLVVSGQGIARVVRTGSYTEMGKIGKSLQEIKEEKTLLQKEIDSLVGIVAVAAIVLCAIVVVLYAILRGNWLNGILTGITLAMSILPEEFPVVLTIFLAIGAWRMSHKNVLARRQHAIQALGSATVICSDKTGTITRNKMSVKKIFGAKKVLTVTYDEIPEEFHEIVEFGILASQEEPFDPMEKALRELSTNNIKDKDHIHYDWNQVKQYPLSSEMLAVSHAWSSPDKDSFIIAAKGAPEAISDLCHMNQVEKDKMLKIVSDFSSEGLRVLGVAKAEFKDREMPLDHHDFEFSFVGLFGFEDPIRDSVPTAIKDCYSAGIRVIMITGDYPGTAVNVARKIGLNNPDVVLTGPEIALLSDIELCEKIKYVNIFARVIPQQKLRLVQALKGNGEIVSMTGDGVNDAPALKAADIGVAMGSKGTDVAREASSVVILDDDFGSIVNGIRMGRRIFDNIRKAMAYVLAVHIPIAGVTLLSVLMGWPLILLPVHILFLELIIDPACSVVFEAEKEEKNIMRRAPRNPKEKIFSSRTVWFAVLQGFIVLLFVAAVFFFTFKISGDELRARAMAFTTLIFANLLLIASNLSWSQSLVSHISRKNRALWITVGSAIIFMAIILFVPFVRNLFKFGPLSYLDILIAIGAAVVSISWFEVYKIIDRRKSKSSIKKG